MTNYKTRTATEAIQAARDALNDRADRMDGHLYRLDAIVRGVWGPYGDIETTVADIKHEVESAAFPVTTEQYAVSRATVKIEAAIAAVQAI
jgi:hypothetical protein